MDYTITLTTDQETALKKALDVENLTTGLQTYVSNIADQYIKSRVEEEISKLTTEEKKALLIDFEI